MNAGGEREGQRRGKEEGTENHKKSITKNDTGCWWKRDWQNLLVDSRLTASVPARKLTTATLPLCPPHKYSLPQNSRLVIWNNFHCQYLHLVKRLKKLVYPSFSHSFNDSSSRQWSASSRLIWPLGHVTANSCHILTTGKSHMTENVSASLILQLDDVNNQQKASSIHHCRSTFDLPQNCQGGGKQGDERL